MNASLAQSTPVAQGPAIPGIGNRPDWATFGDAVAMIDSRRKLVTWTSPGWLAQWPHLGPGSSLADLASFLPQATAVLEARPDRKTRVTNDGTQLIESIDPRVWEIESEAVDADHLAIRVSNQHERGLAIQRQLDDRERLLFTSRVLSVGEMATTLAHELNQPIAAASNLLRGLKLRLSRRQGALEASESAALDRTLDQVLFAAKVIARIRDFTHSHKPRVTDIDIADLLRTSAELLDWDLQRANVALTIAGADVQVAIRGDAVMLQQVVVNLMRNAIDAMRCDPPEQPKLALRLIDGSGQIEVQVSDNGCGLADQEANRLFVPFASSKPNGMGIGLSICRSFVELHQGRLWFSRNPDRGTTFHLTLPRTQTRALGESA